MPDLFEPDVGLRWRGKETKVKTVSLPFQTVEYIRLPKSDRLRKSEQADPRWEGWTNRLIWGDNKNVMASLLGAGVQPDRLLVNDPCFVEGAEAIAPEFKRRMFNGQI